MFISLNQVMSDGEVPERSQRSRSASGSPARSRSGSRKSREDEDMAETQIEAEAETQVRQILKLPIQFIIYDLIRSEKIIYC